MHNLLPGPLLAAAFQATDVLGWLFTLGLAGSVWQGIKHAQRAYRAQDKQDKLEEAAWAIGIAGLVAFYNEMVDLFLDDRPLERPAARLFEPPAAGDVT